MDFVWFILIGLCAGFIAGQLTKGRGFGFWMNLIIGVLGGVLGGWLFGLMGFGTGNLLGSLLVSVCGAIVLLFLASLVSKK